MLHDIDHQEVLKRLKYKLMDNPRSSNGNIRGIFQPPIPMVKEKALKNKLIQFNGPKYTSYLLFDIDQSNAMHAWQTFNLPQPTLVIENPYNGHAHYAYELSVPVKLGNYKTAYFASVIRDTMRIALQSDPNYKGNLTKNPFHHDWRVQSHNRTYTFAELIKHLDMPEPKQTKQKRRSTQSNLSNITKYSRNLTFKDWLRYWSYANVRFYSNQQEFEIALKLQAELFNNEFVGTLQGKLKDFEVRKWVKWILPWTWQRYTEGKFRYNSGSKRQPLLNLPISMSLHERQQIGQDYTSQQRVAKTEDKIVWAIQTLTKDGCPVNKSSVSRLTGLSRPTVYVYWEKANEWIKQELISDSGFSKVSDCSVKLR